MVAAVALLDRDELAVRCEALEAANARLQDELDAVRAEKCGSTFCAPVEWGLTSKEQAIVGVLLTRELCSKEALHMALYSDLPDGGPEIKIIDVFVCKVRRKVERYGVLIETIWGKGYIMPAATKALVRELIAASPTVSQTA